MLSRLSGFHDHRLLPGEVKQRNYQVQLLIMLSIDLLRGLDAHKYSCAGRSLVEPVFQIFWNWLIELIPMWLAPNLITFIGLLSNIIGSLTLFWFCPTLTEAAPSWSYFLAAISLFIYQALDAVDGKQARRTQSASPLGELFDHGCDALSGGLLILSTMCVLRIGDSSFVVFSSLLVELGVFYSAHWRAYTSGTLQFGYIDVTEAQVGMMGVAIASGIWGPGLWITPIVGNWKIGELFIQSVNVIAFLVMLNNCRHAFQGRFSGHCRVDSWLSPAVPYATLSVTTIAVLLVSPTGFEFRQPLLIGLLYSVISAQIASRLVVAHMSKTPMVLFDFSVLPMQVILLNSLIGAAVPEFQLYVVCLLVSSVNLCVTSGLMCQEIATHMGIYVFTIGKRGD